MKKKFLNSEIGRSPTLFEANIYDKRSLELLIRVQEEQSI